MSSVDLERSTPTWVRRIVDELLADARAECPVPPMHELQGVLVSAGYELTDAWNEFMRQYGGLRIRNPLGQRQQPPVPPEHTKISDENKLLFDSTVARLLLDIEVRGDYERTEVERIESQTGAERVLLVGGASDLSSWYIDSEGGLWWKNWELQAEYWGTDLIKIIDVTVERVFRSAPADW